MQVIPNNLKEEFPFSPHFHQIGSHKQHYVDEGQGETIVFLHGNPTWSFYYRNLIKSFSSNYRVIAPDHIGCGLSDKPQEYTYRLHDHISNAQSLLQKLNVKKFHLVVHDWGGAIGMGLATISPENILSITFCNTAAYTCDYIPWQINLCRTPILGNFFIRRFNAFAGPATKMAVAKSMSKRVKSGYLFPYNNYKSRIATSRFVQDIPMREDHPSYSILKGIENKLKNLSCPKLFLWGKKDFCFNDYFLNRWKSIYPTAKFIEFENAGHYVLEDEPDRCALELRDFLGQV